MPASGVGRVVRTDAATDSVAASGHAVCLLSCVDYSAAGVGAVDGGGVGVVAGRSA